MTSKEAITDVAIGDISVRKDDRDGIIRIEGWGFLTVDQIETMFRQARLLVEDCHAHSAPALVLVDNRRIMIHGSEAAERIRQRAEHTYQQGDRVAIVVESVLARMQFRRVIDTETHRLFPSLQTARDWLNS